MAGRKKKKTGFSSSILGAGGRTVIPRHMDSVYKQVLLSLPLAVNTPDPEETQQPTGHLVVSVWG